MSVQHCNAKISGYFVYHARNKAIGNKNYPVEDLECIDTVISGIK